MYNSSNFQQEETTNTWAAIKNYWHKRIISDRRLSASEQQIAGFLMHYFNNKKGGSAWPSYKHLATITNRAEQTVLNAIKNLVGHGFIVRESGKKSRSPNQYYMKIANKKVTSKNYKSFDITPTPDGEGSQKNTYPNSEELSTQVQEQLSPTGPGSINKNKNNISNSDPNGNFENAPSTNPINEFSVILDYARCNRSLINKMAKQDVEDGEKFPPIKHGLNFSSPDSATSHEIIEQVLKRLFEDDEEAKLREVLRSNGHDEDSCTCVIIDLMNELEKFPTQRRMLSASLANHVIHELRGQGYHSNDLESLIEAYLGAFCELDQLMQIVGM